MTRTRLETFQWIGLFAGPLAFMGEHVAGFFATAAGCNPAGWSVPVHAIVLGVTALAALVIVLSELAAYLAFREVQAVDKEDDPPLGRIKFLSTAGLIIGPLFLALVLLGGLGSLAHPTCHQA